MNSSNRISRVFLGMVASFLLLSLFVGGPVNAISLILVSIICTGGVSLILWIPLWFGVGLVISSLLPVVTNSFKKSEAPEHNISNDQKALIDYIHQSRAKGVSDDNVFSLLKSNGWAENAIHDAFGLVATHKET
ncbi:MAG: hypothetical protein UT00_C0013G0013 [Parcubacteria group bacterium GW2011_GWA1_38_7]|nr:MAG: hypothetical protein UT00_C0013G0013 [Parcubacteria group bacterium GW2011_GWA1_38_7]